MKPIQRTSLLLCLTIFVVFAAAAIVFKWPVIAAWLDSQKPRQTAGYTGADPFGYNPPLPSLVKELHPVYQIKAELNPDESEITGSMTLQFDNPKTAEIFLYIYDYTWSPITITSLQVGDKPAVFQRRGAIVTLKPPKEEASGRLTLQIAFRSKVPRGCTRFGMRENIWTLTNWYPMLGSLNQQNQWYEPPKPVGYGDPFFYQYADYDVSFVSPGAYRWVSSWGRGEGKPVSDGKQEVRYTARRVLNFALVGSPNYQIESVQVSPKLTVDIASADPVRLKQIKEIAGTAFSAYSEQFGELAYPHAAVAETGGCTVYAMEYANMAIFSRDLFAQKRVDHWLPHEIAHLWWYNSVATLKPIHSWLDEGLVEASVYFYLKKRHGQAAADQLLTEYALETSKLSQHYPDGSLAKHLVQFSSYNEFDWTWYSKGAMLYHRLRQQIGDKQFSQFLKRVQRNYQGKVIGPAHLDQALSQTLNGEAQYFVPNAAQPNRNPFLPLQVERYVGTVINDMIFYPATPAREHGKTVYLPLAEIMKKVGFEMSAGPHPGELLLKADGRELRLSENSPDVTWDKQTYQLSAKTLKANGQLMVPLDFFEKVMKYRVRYDADAKTVRIDVVKN
ncbi:M1 family aminopeptidase [Brevibacillus sp. B_LB10_24]|uniref:M1 family aminopeptidase n=1 Tax=Brevibacillus sp. B_LB10_24 TaxID=3380645 RepID=UPI0038BCEC1C